VTPTGSDRVLIVILRLVKGGPQLIYQPVELDIHSLTPASQELMAASSHVPVTVVRREICDYGPHQNNSGRRKNAETPARGQHSLVFVSRVLPSLHCTFLRGFRLFVQVDANL
jgi:hypothetical protein